MSHVAELLAKLSPGAANLCGIGGVYGKITQADLAMALGCLSGKSHPDYGLNAGRAAADLLIINYQGDQGVLKPLERNLLHIVINLALREHWPSSPSHLLGNLIRLALEEFLDTGRCQTCKGNNLDELGSSRVQDARAKWVICPKCNGVGKQSLSDKSRSTYVQMDDMAWRRWRPRQAQIFTLLTELDSWGLDRMHYILGGA